MSYRTPWIIYCTICTINHLKETNYEKAVIDEQYIVITDIIIIVILSRELLCLHAQLDYRVYCLEKYHVTLLFTILNSFYKNILACTTQRSK